MIKIYCMKSNYKTKIIAFLLINILLITNSFAQATAPAPAATTSGSLNIPLNTLLFCIAIVLLIIIVILASTVNGAIELYKVKKNNTKDTNLKTLVAMLGFLLLTQTAFSQAAPAADAAKIAASTANTASNLYFYAFIVIILVEIAIILFFIKTLRFLTGIEQLSKDAAEKGEKKSLWASLNNFRPIEEEGDLDTGHSYDGIRELDNATPSWFTIGFAGTIVFAIVYFYQFNFSGSIPRQEDEFAAEMRQAQILQDSLTKLEGNKFDENSVTMLGAADIADGAKLYSANCSPCHGDKGQGVVGPNLTDKYWLHGGSIKDVFKTIKYGYVDKGMKAWKDDFSPKQIAQLASFVESLKGTNPPNPKEKQGELYEGDNDAAPATAEKTAETSALKK